MSWKLVAKNMMIDGIQQNFEDLSKPCRYTGIWMFEILYGKKSVPDLDKERPQAIPLVRPLVIPHLHDWSKMELCLINFNKVENDERCLKFCNIHKWGATVKGKLLNGCLESTVHYDSKGVKVQ